ncbi:MAG: hypothetical protein AAF711_00575 [Planctomycetota bacterium]
MQSKHPLQSKTFLGLALTAIFTALAMAAVYLGSTETAQLMLGVIPFTLAFAGYGRWVADGPLSMRPSEQTKRSSGYCVAALLTPLLLITVGCASTAADQGTSSGWTDAQGQNVTVNFYASGSETAAEAVEGDGVPAGRIVLEGSTINVTVTVGAEGAAESQRGDTGATNTPEIDATIDASPIP